MEPVLSYPRLESAALHTLVVHLKAARGGSCPANCGRAIHAQVLHWLQMADPAISETIHQSQESPISLSGLINPQSQSRVREGDGLYFRIGLLDGRLIEPLVMGLEMWGLKSLSLVNFPFVIESINMVPGTDPWVGSSSYVLLANTQTSLDDITLHFLSPTSFKLHNGQGIQPFPLPESVFGSLHRRWNSFAPEGLKLPKIEWTALVSNYDLKTRKLKMENSIEIGAIGWVRYRFPDKDQARIATVLSQFAFFAGVGRKTAMGMGMVQPISSSNQLTHRNAKSR